MPDNRVADDEARQASSHDASKVRVEKQVQHELTREIADAQAGGHDRVAEVAAGLRSRALDETERGELQFGRARKAARTSQFIDYGFYVLYGLLAIRLALALIGARPGNGFVRFIGALTAPFYLPFRGIVASPSSDGGSMLLLPVIIALIAYGILHAAVNGGLRMVGTRKTAV